MQKNTVDITNMPEITVDRDYPCFQPSLIGVQRRKYQRYFKTHSTYLGLIAYVIQESPNKKLTFSQIMDKMQAFLSGDRKGLVNNIRVCLSSNACFVKVPVNPDNPRARSNFWKVDESKITPKILRRHFRDMLDIFPSLSTQGKLDAGIRRGSGVGTLASASSTVQEGCAVKFSGPFSIDSILKKNSSCAKPAVLYLASGANPQKLCTDREKGTKRKMRWENHDCSSQSRAAYRSHVSGGTTFQLDPGCHRPCFFTEDLSHPTFGDITGPNKRMRLSSGIPVSLTPTASSVLLLSHYFNNHQSYYLKSFSCGLRFR